MKTKTNPLSISKIKSIALNLRASLGLSSDMAFPIFEYLKKLYDDGLISIQILDDSDSFLENDCIAKYSYLDNFIYIKESVLIDLENCEYRSNFTLAHELFHYIQLNILGFKVEYVSDCKSYEDIEWQANEFASQLLLPEEALLLDDDTLEQKYKISKIAIMTRRLYNSRRSKNNVILK